MKKTIIFINFVLLDYISKSNYINLFIFIIKHLKDIYFDMD